MKDNDLRCPGQNTMFWKPDDIYDVVCPNCGDPVEFWKDDSKRICRCGHRFLNPKRDLGCLEYCKYAEQCMPEMFEGESLKALYRDRLLAAAKIALKPEESLLQKSIEVTEVAEEILAEEGGEPKVVIAAAILGELLGSPVGASETPTAGRENSDRATTIKILADLGTEKEVIDQVCQVVENRSEEIASKNVSIRIVLDALKIIKLTDKKGLFDQPALERFIKDKIQTKTGRRLARERLLQDAED